MRELHFYYDSFKELKEISFMNMTVDFRDIVQGKGKMVELFINRKDYSISYKEEEKIGHNKKIVGTGAQVSSMIEEEDKYIKSLNLENQEELKVKRKKFFQGKEKKKEEYKEKKENKGWIKSFTDAIRIW